MKSDCPQRSMAADFANGELPSRTAADYANHIAACESCRNEVASFRELLHTLRSLPETEVSSDLTAPVLARLRHETSAKPSHRPWRFTAAAAAAAMVAFVCSKHAWRQAPSAPPPAFASGGDPSAASLGKAMEWLRANQENDGSWDGGKWGGRPEFDIALTALPALAMLSSGHGDEPAVSKAVEWLKNRQNADGLFGKPGVGLPYNHCLATLVLLHASVNQASSHGLRETIAPALAAMLRSQTSDGGWGNYRSPFASSAITAWHVQALELAASMGWENAKPALERGKTWLETHDPFLGKTLAPQIAEASAPNVLLDMCGTYFMANRLSHETDATARDKLSAIRNALVVQQATSGEAAGSWPPDHYHGKAGGRLYSTALALMSLNGP